MTTQGRLADPAEFGNIVVKATNDATVLLRDVARIELAAQDYGTNSYLSKDLAVALAVFQRPGSNALATADGIRSAMRELGKRFPSGVEYKIVYDPTQFISELVNAVVWTILEAIALVVLVIILFLQTWRAAIIPIIAIPVSLIGTFFVMAAFGFTLNNLTLFGLVLSIGIVVDDAIVVVENVERNIEAGLSPREAAHKSMDEVGAALVAIVLVLAAVFVPAAFISGISGQFYRQFALTITSATVISLVVSLTLSPALCALVLKPHTDEQVPLWARPLRLFFNMFNRGYKVFADTYGWAAGRVVRIVTIMLVGYVAVIAIGLNEFRRTPIGFIPQLDRGYLIIAAQLPPGSALNRTDEVMLRIADIALKVPGVTAGVNIVGFSGASFSVAPNAGAFFAVLEPFDQRAGDPRKGANAIQAALTQQLASIQEAFVVVVAPPPVQGIGNAGGFRMMIEDRAGRGPDALQGTIYAMMGRASQTPGLTNVFSFFETATPQIYLDIDRTKAQLLGVNISDVFSTLQIYLGSSYVNDFNLFGRSYRVVAQAEARNRLDSRDVLTLRVRNAQGETVPLGSFTTISDIAGPYRVPRYNLYPAAELDGAAAPGYSQGQAIEIMQRLAAETLPDGFSYEWTTLAFQQLRTGNTAAFAFVLAVVFVFLVLAAQFESHYAPAVCDPDRSDVSDRGDNGRHISLGQDNNILTQVGFIVLIALAARNAVLMVEFAKQLEDRGRDTISAAVEAAKLRLRPIVMTSMAFILGTVPLVWATGAGAELRQALGTPVFAGMIGVTFFGLIFTPVFYVVCRRLGQLGSRRTPRAPRPSRVPAE